MPEVTRLNMKLLAWDFDGTLAFREGMWSKALADVACDQLPGCELMRDAFVPHLQSGFPWHNPELPHTHITSHEQWWEHLSPVIENAFVKGAGVSIEQAKRLVPHVRANYADPARWALFDDVLPCLKELTENGWKHVILSNHVPELPTLVKALGLAPHIAAVFNSATLGYEKPHPKSFGAVLTSFQDAVTVWMVGDNYVVDVQGARAAGLSAILVRKAHPGAAEFHETLSSIPLALAGI
jgi:putative hydrolase of the HAD superfamily